MNRSMVPTEYSRPESGPGSFDSTLVSIVPFPIIEEKPGLIPGHFELEASTDGRPRCSVIGECIHYVWIDEVRGSLKVKNPSYQVANSVVSDYLTSQLEVGPEAHPGFFWLPGARTPDDVEKLFADKLLEMKRRQTSWFINLVKLADDDWQKTRQHYAISDLQRYAARAIDPENKQQRPWVFVTKEEDETPLNVLKMIQCPHCLSEIPERALVCRYCQRDIAQGINLAKVLGK